MDKRIVLVDDEEIILNTYCSLLGEEGYDVITADSGSKALEMFYQQPFDLVITDLAMMGEDGLSLLEKIKTISPATPLIVFTGTRSRVVNELWFFRKKVEAVQIVNI